MFSGSSRDTRRMSPDGRHAVVCWMCNEPISLTGENVSRAICALCQYTMEHNEPLPDGILDLYKLAKTGVRDVTMVHLKKELQIADSVNNKKFSLNSLGGDILYALGFKKASPVVEPVQSTAVAVQKRRTSLFSDIVENDNQLAEDLKQFKTE